MPNDVLKEILSHCHTDETDSEKALKNHIKNFMKCVQTCKHFNRLLTGETIGHLCKNYPVKLKMKCGAK